jgi:hypothetical protein
MAATISPGTSSNGNSANKVRMVYNPGDLSEAGPGWMALLRTGFIGFTL